MSQQKTLQVTIKDENGLKARLDGFKKVIESNNVITEFDRTVFESIVENIIVGGVDGEGNIDPAILTIFIKQE